MYWWKTFEVLKIIFQKSSQQLPSKTAVNQSLINKYKYNETEQEIKEMVKAKIQWNSFKDKETNASSCCGAGGCSTEVYNIMSEEYNKLDGYNPDADLGLGCGLPNLPKSKKAILLLI